MASRDQIIAILGRYRVQKHYRATTEAGATRYAVFTDAGQLTEPALSAEARAEQQRRTVDDLLALFDAGMRD